MTGDFKNPHVPPWRIAFWICLGIAAFAWIGHKLGDLAGLVAAGAILVPMIALLILGLIRIGRSEWVKRNLRTLILIYIALQSALLIWKLVEN